jgi:hypothetical protein
VVWICPNFNILRYAILGSLQCSVMLRWYTITNYTASYLTIQQSLPSLKKEPKISSGIIWVMTGSCEGFVKTTYDLRTLLSTWKPENASRDTLLIKQKQTLTFILLMWKIEWIPNNANKWQVGFNSAFKGLNCRLMVLWKGTSRQTDFVSVLLLSRAKCEILSPHLNAVFPYSQNIIFQFWNDSSIWSK